MHPTLLLEPARILLVGYILAFVCLNFLMFVISSFYMKKIGQKSPRMGFVFAIILALGYAGSMLVSFNHGSTSMRFIRFILIILCAVVSAISSLNLFFTMRKVRK